jgi:hypothetical protein
MKCVGCAVKKLSGDKGFFAGMAFARLMTEPSTKAAVAETIKQICPEHQEMLRGLTGLKLIVLAGRITDVWGRRRSKASRVENLASERF